MSLLRLEDIGKRFADGTEALRGLSFALEEGTFTSLLGPSGCGKSTVLRLIAGLAAPSAGRVIWDNPRDTEGLGFVFQEPTLMPWRTVWGNVYLPLRLAGVSRAEAEPRIAAALSQMGLSDFVRSYPRQLSGGMKMRVSIARALVTKPRLLLMDEPFAALDEITRARLNDDLLALQRAEGLSIVFVTHSVYESVYLSDRIVVMAARPGRVVADIEVLGPARRDEVFRTSDSYNQHCRVVSQALRAAMGERDRAA